MSRVEPKVSVIMPAYNVGPYIARAIESIQRQTLSDIEILVVDDGSTDSTASVLDRLASRDLRIEAFHTKNAGAPAARNLALDHARGTYVMFMDADDWCEPTMLEDMVQAADEHHLDLVITGFYIDTYTNKENEVFSEIKSCPSALYTSAEAFRADAWKLFDANQLYTPWNKLFVRKRINDCNIRFKPTFWDDFPFVLDYIRDAERIEVIEKPYYHFIRQRSESETSKWRPDMYEKREEEHTWMLDLYQHWQMSEDPDSNEMIQRRYIERLVGCIENVCNPQNTLSKPEKISLIAQMIQSPRAQEAVSVAKPRSTMMKVMLVPIKQKNASLAYTEGCFISWVRRHNSGLFARLKSRR